MESPVSLPDFLAALEAARPFLRDGVRPKKNLRGKWYRDSLDLAWACVYVLETGPGHFVHLSFAPGALRGELDRLQELQVARDAAAALFSDAEAELDACKLAVTGRSREVVRSIGCRLADPQRGAHGGLLSLAGRVLELVDRRGARLRAGHRAAAARAAAAALQEENGRLQEESGRCFGVPPAALPAPATRAAIIAQEPPPRRPMRLRQER